MSQDKRRKPSNDRRKSPASPPYQKNPSIWKALIIQFLRGTIGVLENTVVKLETEPPPTTVKKPNLLARLFLGWDRFLQTFRLFLPSKISNNVSDTVLTIILGLFFVVVIGISKFIFTSKPTPVATLPPVAEVPTPAPNPTSTSEPEPIPTSTSEPELTPTSTSQPTLEPQTTSEPEPTLKPEITPEPEPIPTSTPEPTLKPEITPPPEPIPTSTPEPTLKPEITPPPEPKEIIQLTPEQALIAAIENQLEKISVVTIKNQEDENIAVKLIKSIQANFRSSDLTITISNDWYKLEKTQQQKLAADILQLSQALDFTHLQLVDSQNRLLARSPVVGNQMIIFVTHSGVRSEES